MVGPKNKKSLFIILNNHAHEKSSLRLRTDCLKKKYCFLKNYLIYFFLFFITTPE